MRVNDGVLFTVHVSGEGRFAAGFSIAAIDLLLIRSSYLPIKKMQMGERIV